MRCKNKETLCLVEDCEKEAKKKGYCENHYRMFKKHGDPNINKNPRHEMSKWPEYRVWNTMRYRCNNPNYNLYHRYGGRGISVCDRWASSFVNFIEDMGRRPSPNHQIDRTNNDGNYEPSNCKWVSPSENRINQKNRVCTPEVREILKKDRAAGLSYNQIAKKNNIPMPTVYYTLTKAVII